MCPKTVPFTMVIALPAGVWPASARGAMALAAGMKAALAPDIKRIPVPPRAVSSRLHLAPAGPGGRMRLRLPLWATPLLRVGRGLTAMVALLTSAPHPADAQEGSPRTSAAAGPGAVVVRPGDTIRVVSPRWHPRARAVVTTVHRDSLQVRAGAYGDTVLRLDGSERVEVRTGTRRFTVRGLMIGGAVGLVGGALDRAGMGDVNKSCLFPVTDCTPERRRSPRAFNSAKAAQWGAILGVAGGALGAIVQRERWQPLTTPRVSRIRLDASNGGGIVATVRF